MKKKFRIILLFLVSFLICSNFITVKAEENIIANCVYKNGSNSITINIDNNYKISFSSTSYNKQRGTCTGKCTLGNLTMENIYFDSFMDDNKFNCNNLKTIYLNFNSVASSQQAKISYTIKTSKDEINDFEYMLDESKSKTVKETPDKDLIESEGWLAICHYENIILFIKENDYKVINSFGTDNEKNIEPENFNLFLKKIITLFQHYLNIVGIL